MGRYEKPQLAHWNAAAYGPGIGPRENPARTDDFLRQCAGAGVQPERFARLREVMQCARCHNGERRGVLNFPSAYRPQPLTGSSLIEAYVVKHKRMPPDGEDLDDAERAALARCLRDEYYGTVNHRGLYEQWLANAACFRE
jgi:hypothetical protein